MTEPCVAYRTVCYCPESARFEVHGGGMVSLSVTPLCSVAKVVVREARKLF